MGQPFAKYVGVLKFVLLKYKLLLNELCFNCQIITHDKFIPEHSECL